MENHGDDPKKSKQDNQRFEIINIKLANIQGLKQDKYTTLEEAYLGKGCGHNIVCLTETQLKEDNIRMGENVVSYNAMREKDGDEKKGGGLMILHRKNKKMNFEKIENKNKNLLEMEGDCYGLKIRLILAYAVVVCINEKNC